MMRSWAFLVKKEDGNFVRFRLKDRLMTCRLDRSVKSDRSNDLIKLCDKFNVFSFFNFFRRSFSYLTRELLLKSTCSMSGFWKSAFVGRDLVVLLANSGKEPRLVTDSGEHERFADDFMTQMQGKV